MNSRLKRMQDADAAPSQRDTILRAAAQLFSKKGYDGTTVRELADAVGLQSGSLFHHFKSKDEILFAVMEQGLAFASASVVAAETQAKTPREKFENVLRAYLTALLTEDHRDYMSVLLYDFRSLSPELAKRVQQFRRQLAGRLEAVLEEAFPGGDSRPSVRLKAQYIFGAMNWAVQWYKPHGTPAALDEMAQQFTQLSLAAAGLNMVSEQ